VPLALALLGPVIVNIILYHLLLTPGRGAVGGGGHDFVDIFSSIVTGNIFSGIFVQKAL